MQLISAVVITKNEERIIAKCIHALQQVADEIIIVDSESTDKTVEIAESMGAKVYVQKWLGFGPQKNFGNSHATHNYVLALDADEVLTEQAIAEINELKKTGLHGVYQFKLIHFYFGKFLKHGLETPGYKRRLFDKTVVSWNENIVHEALIIPDGYPIVNAKGFVEHYSYYNVQHYLTKANYYTTLSAERLYAKGKRNYIVKLLFSPGFIFFKAYFLKLGFLDGFHGFIVAMFNMHTDFAKYAKLRELCRNKTTTT